MKIIVCADDRMGVAFNGRRQSRDRRVIADIAAELDGTLYIDPYSEPLFEGSGVQCETVPDIPGTGVYFNEKKPLSGALAAIDTLIVYRWNRLYPSDVLLDIDPAAAGFVLRGTYDFAGASHERITKEIWEKKGAQEA